MRAHESFDVAEYAALVATLADPDCDRAAILRAHDLDEDAWAELDRVFQDRLSRALDEDGDGVPELVAAYAEAFERARAASSGARAVIPIERFADATREIQRRGDPVAALTQVGISLEQFIRANEHWTRRMLEDPALFERFRRRL